MKINGFVLPPTAHLCPSLEISFQVYIGLWSWDFFIPIISNNEASVICDYPINGMEKYMTIHPDYNTDTGVYEYSFPINKTQSVIDRVTKGKRWKYA